MRAAGAVVVLAVTALFGLSAGRADAGRRDPQDWYGKAKALVQSLLDDGATADAEVVAPPLDIDPRMALAPPGPRGTLRIITPPERSEQP